MADLIGNVSFNCAIVNRYRLRFHVCVMAA